MNRKILIFLLLIVFSNNIKAQILKIGFGAGFLQHSQNDLKNLNEQVKSSLPFETNTTNSFPTTPYVQGEVGLDFKKIYIGSIYLFNSTGTRITASDYSGTYKYDIVLSANIIGLKIGKDWFLNESFKITYKHEIGAIYSSLKMKESFDYENESLIGEELSLMAKSIYTKPNIQFGYTLKRFDICMSAAYMFDFKSSFHLKDDTDAKLINKNRKEVKTNWNGLELGVNIYFNIPMSVN